MTTTKAKPFTATFTDGTAMTIKSKRDLACAWRVTKGSDYVITGWSSSFPLALKAAESEARRGGPEYLNKAWTPRYSAHVAKQWGTTDKRKLRKIKAIIQEANFKKSKIEIACAIAQG